MSAKVAIVVGTGGALGHATAAVVAAVCCTVVPAGRSDQALYDLPDHVRPRWPAPPIPAAATRLIDRIAARRTGGCCWRTALERDPAFLLRRPGGGRFPDGVCLPVARRADAAR